MTNRRKPAQRPTSTAWKPTRPRAELLTAIGAACAVVVVTVLVIFLIKPSDSATVPSTPAVTTPAGAQDTTSSTAATSTPAQP